MNIFPEYIKKNESTTHHFLQEQLAVARGPGPGKWAPVPWQWNLKADQLFPGMASPKFFENPGTHDPSMSMGRGLVYFPTWKQ